MAENLPACDCSNHAEIPRDYPNYVAFVCERCGRQQGTMPR